MTSRSDRKVPVLDFDTNATVIAEAPAKFHTASDEEWIAAEQHLQELSATVVREQETDWASNEPVPQA